MSKGSKPRPYTNKKDYYSNWDNIKWDNKNVCTNTDIQSQNKELNKPFGNDISYYEDRN